MEEALDKFIESWKSKKNVLGILLTGSYAVGLQNKDSDIDIRIVFDNNQKKTIKGLLIIDNYRFSYLGRSLNGVKKKFNDEFIEKQKFEAYIFNVGKILYENKNHLEDLKDLAKMYVSTPSFKKNFIKSEIKAGLYGLFSHKNHIMSLEENSPFFYYQCFVFFKKALTFYSSYLGYEKFLDTKTEKVLCDSTYRIAYHWDNFPDHTFAKKWVNLISIQNVNKNSINEIYLYVESKIEKINEESFKIHWYEN